MQNKEVKNFFLRTLGSPDLRALHIDRGTNFASNLFNKACKDLGINRRSTTT